MIPELMVWVREAEESTSLTRKQAKAYYLRESGYDRNQSAEMMDTTLSNLDNLHQTAKKKLDEAQKLVELNEQLQ